MNHLLKALGFWVWGLVAIGLSVSMVSVSYRMLALHRSYGLADRQTSAVESKITTALPPEVRSSATQQAPVALKGTLALKGTVALPGTGLDTSRQRAAPVDQEAPNVLQEASSTPPPPTHESKSVRETAGQASISLDKLRSMQSDYESALSRGAYKEDELVRVFRLLFQLAATLQQNAKAIAYGQKADDLGGLNSNDMLILSQLYYQERDCKNSGIWGDKAIAGFKKKGEAPKEVLYQLKLQCASDGNDGAGMKAALYDLVRLTNKTIYWNNLLRLERQDERDDRGTLMIYRIMYDTHSMNADTDYIEMAQLLGDAGLPGEAQAVLERAMSSGVFKDEHQGRAERLLNALRTRAQADEDGLAALDAAAGKNPAGQLDLKLGEVYFGAADYPDAAWAINRAIGKGQMRQPEDAFVYLGRSQKALNNNADAKDAFAHLKSLPNLNPRVQRLWNLYSDTIPTEASQPL